VVYFVGFYWLFNWQTVPYTFALGLFFPLLALLRRPKLQQLVLLLLLFCVGIETHALFGIWSILIVAFLLVGGWVVHKICQKLSRPEEQPVSLHRNPASNPEDAGSQPHRIKMEARRLLLAMDSEEQRRGFTGILLLLMMFIQASVIIFKNREFLDYVIQRLQDSYRAVFGIGFGEQVLGGAVGSAVSNVPADPAAIVLKALSWLSLGLVGIAFVSALVAVIRDRRLRLRELAFLGAGTIHFAIGTQFAAIGTRSLQVIALVPAFFVADTIARGTKISRFVVLATLASLLLFPASIMLNIQGTTSFVKPSDIYFKETLAAKLEDGTLPRMLTLTEHVRPLELNKRAHLVSSRWLRNRVRAEDSEALENICNKQALLVDTAQLRQEMSGISGQSSERIEASLSSVPTFYDSGLLALRWVQQFDMLGLCQP
jgi:hypothetical protein